MLKRSHFQDPAQVYTVLKLNNFNRTEYFLAAPSRAQKSIKEELENALSVAQIFRTY